VDGAPYPFLRSSLHSENLSTQGLNRREPKPDNEHDSAKFLSKRNYRVPFQAKTDYALRSVYMEDDVYARAASEEL
jgi:hypothetical protein